MKIQDIEIKNFKIHKDTKLNLKNLTILTGINSAGKSSVIQSLLLLRQSKERQVLNDGLQLNGDYYHVGTYQQALCSFGDSNSISFLLGDGDRTQSWTFNQGESNDYTRDFIKLQMKEGPEVDWNLFSKDFHYISAFRLPPQESYPMDSHAVEDLHRLSQKFGRCELAIHYLNSFKEMTVPFGCLCHAESQCSLLSEVSAWESDMGMNVNVIPKNLSSTSFGLYFNYSNLGLADDVSALNVGFGMSYVLPILVALLSANENSLILIENPEAHLHPKAISVLCNLIARTAQSGAQIIVETHSDHVIQGIEVACKKFEEERKGISNHNVIIYAFNHTSGIEEIEINKIEVLEHGRLSYQPENFLDQQDIDLGYLLNI